MRRVFRTKPAAEYVGLAESTLEKFRLAGTGPRFIRLGARAVGYDVADLDAWLDARRHPDAPATHPRPLGGRRPTRGHR